MPRKDKNKKKDSEDKKSRLTLAQLAAYDDVSTDVMIDQAHWLEFREPIRKNRGNKYFAVRVQDEAVSKVLLHKLIHDKNLEGTEKALFSLPGVKRYMGSLRTANEREQFKYHFHKYIDMYKTDCPFEVSTTNRYTVTSYEAAITARRRIKQGETIKYLTGTLVPLTAEESADLDLTQRNFSIVVTNRRKNGSIFLGPARFANHDCEANGRLVPTGADSMEVKAVKNIDVGEEITVTYGDGYFGPNNMDCLCHSCERDVRNGWTSTVPQAAPRGASSPGPRVVQEFPSNGRKRGRPPKVTSNASSGFSPSPKRPKLALPQSSLRQQLSPPASSTSQVDDLYQIPKDEAPSMKLADAEIAEAIFEKKPSQIGKLNRPSIKRRISTSGTTGIEAEDFDVLELPPTPISSSDEDQRPRKRQRLVDMMTTSSPPDQSSAVFFSSAKSSTLPSPDAPGSDDVPSVGSKDPQSITEQAVTIKVESTDVVKIEDDDIVTITADHGTTASAIPDLAAAAPQATTCLNTTTTTKLTASSDNALPSVETAISTHLTVRPTSDSHRHPGDYILTYKLLAQPHDRWVKCRTCYNCFIQSNGYQTRRECPRCERHSKLYGFSWPKTDPNPHLIPQQRGRSALDKATSGAGRKGKSGKGSWVVGGGDPEERVLDHRIVHRFVFPDEEKEITRRGLLYEAQLARDNGTETPDRALGRARASESWDCGEEEEGSSTPEGGLRKSKRFMRDAYAYASSTSRR